MHSLEILCSSKASGVDWSGGWSGAARAVSLQPSSTHYIMTPLYHITFNSTWTALFTYIISTTVIIRHLISHPHTRHTPCLTQAPVTGIQSPSCRFVHTLYKYSAVCLLSFVHKMLFVQVFHKCTQQSEKNIVCILYCIVAVCLFSFTTWLIFSLFYFTFIISYRPELYLVVCAVCVNFFLEENCASARTSITLYGSCRHFGKHVTSAGTQKAFFIAQCT